MKGVVDTTVIAAYVLKAKLHFNEAHKLWKRLSEPMAPSLWQAELANVVWKSVAHGGLALDDGLESLRFAMRLGIQSVADATLWEGAVTAAVKHKHPAYDMLFVQLARREDVPLWTFDKKLLRAFSDIAKMPGQTLRH